MAVFEFVMVVVSIIIGIAISELMMGVVEILRAKAFNRLYWIHTAWVLQVFVLTVVHWATRWGLRSYEGWDYATLSITLLPTVVLLLAAGLLFPKEPVQLRDYYFDQRSTLFSILVILMVLYSVEAWVLFDMPLGNRGDRFRLLVVLMYTPLAFSKNPRTHGVLTILHACTIALSFTTWLGGRGGRLLP